jgi:hypothetical protein
MARRQRSHASFENVENDMARKWINGPLCGLETRATLERITILKRQRAETAGKSH